MAGDRNVTISELLSVSTPTVPSGSFEVESLQVDEIATPSSPASGSMKIYAKSDKKIYSLDSTGAEKAIGSGAGGADVVKLLTADNDAISSFGDTGQNATYGNGGTITAGALAVTSTAGLLLDGETNVFEYDPDANGQNDFFGTVIDIPIGLRGRFLGFKCFYKTDTTYTDGDILFCAEALDGASAGLLTDSTTTLNKYYNASGTGADFRANFFVPYDCTQISVGFQNKTATTTIAFYFDRFEVTADPFVIADFDNIGAWESCTFTGTWVSNTTYTSYRRQVGKNMQYQVKVATSAAPTAADLVLTLPTNDVIDSSVLTNAVSINSQLQNSGGIAAETGVNRWPLQIAYDTTTTVRVRYMDDAASGVITQAVSNTTPCTFLATDYCDLYFEVPLTRLSNKTQHIVTPTSMSQPAKVGTANTTAISTATETFLGFASTIFDIDSRFTNVGSNNNTTYTSTTYYTCANDGYFRVNANVLFTDADLDIDENLALRLTVNGVVVNYSSDMMEGTPTTTQVQRSINTIIRCSRGDRISIAAWHNATGAVSPDGTALYSWFDVEQVSNTPVLGGLPVTNGYIRLRTANGHGSTNTCIRRFTTTVSSIGNAITFADSASLGSTFTINEKGIYAVTYTGESRAAGNAPMGLSLNSAQLTTSIASITDADRLALFDTSAGTFRGHVSWTGYLDVGDVIRAHTAGTMDATTTVGFTIAKLNFRS